KITILGKRFRQSSRKSRNRPIDSDPQVVDCAIIEMKVPAANRFQLRSWRLRWRLRIERPHQQIPHGFLTDETRFPCFVVRTFSSHENLRRLRQLPLVASSDTRRAPWMRERPRAVLAQPSRVEIVATGI